MTPQEALQLLDIICANAQLTRQQHSQGIEAIQTLNVTINIEEKVEEDGDTKVSKLHSG